MNKPLVIYHADCADGFGAAFAAWLKFGDGADYLPMSYLKDNATVWDFNAKLGDHSVVMREVYVLDFSFPRQIMEHLFGAASRVVWIDHHKSSFEMWCGHDYPLRYESMDQFDNGKVSIVLDFEKSGAMLAWDHFILSEKSFGDYPRMIKHIDDYDRWQFKIEGTKEFQRYLWAQAPWTFEQWEGLMFAMTNARAYQRMLREGEVVLRAHMQQVGELVEECKRPIILPFPPSVRRDNVGLAANCPQRLTSDVGAQLAKESGTFGLCWYQDGDGVVFVSLRSASPDCDVSAIAKHFGGGGHARAAGFKTDLQTLLGWLS